MDAALEIKCRTCGAQIPLANIDTDRQIARCEFCGTVYDMAPRADASPGRPEVPLPVKFNVENGERGVVITWRWFSTRHGPLPWPGNTTVQGHDLEQVYCKDKVKRTENGTSVTYEVHAVLEGGRNRKLLARLESDDQALWIEQELEKRLGIADRPVGGELPRY